jgi:tetratricopeptide (TPR) repeat protein
MRGSYQGVDAYYQQSLQLYQEVNDPLGIVTITTNLGEIARLRADYSLAQDFFMRAIKLAQEVHDRDGEMLARHNLAAVSVGMGNYAQAEAALRRLIPTAAAVGWSGLSESHRFLAEACLGQDDLDGALNAAREALILAHEVEELEMIGAAWRVLARLSAAFGGAIALDTTLTDLPDEALDVRRCFARSLHIFREIGVELEQAHTLRSWAEYELTAVGGNRTLGQRYWQQALAIFTRLGIDREIGRMELAIS